VRELEEEREIVCDEEHRESELALQIAQPIALEFLHAAEAYDPTSGVLAAEPRGYESFFPGGAKPSADATCSSIVQDPYAFSKAFSAFQ